MLYLRGLGLDFLGRHDSILLLGKHPFEHAQQSARLRQLQSQGSRLRRRSMQSHRSRVIV